ncbi:MAG: hypothetical protein IPL22_00400 [Bacteroidetes bacterium]|nr:hypothetical protein [Bacteroidota bacterium]
MKNTIYSIALVIITLFVCLNPVRAQVTLVENLGSFDQPDTVFSFGNKNYYVLGTTGTTEQLWVSDGTAFGTSFLATFENPANFIQFREVQICFLLNIVLPDKCNCGKPMAL